MVVEFWQRGTDVSLVTNERINHRVAAGIGCSGTDRTIAQCDARCSAISPSAVSVSGFRAPASHSRHDAAFKGVSPRKPAIGTCRFQAELDWPVGQSYNRTASQEFSGLLKRKDRQTCEDPFVTGLRADLQNGIVVGSVRESKGLDFAIQKFFQLYTRTGKLFPAFFLVSSLGRNACVIV